MIALTAFLQESVTFAFTSQTSSTVRKRTFFFCGYFFLSWVLLVVCACMHSPEVELMHCTDSEFDFSKEEWSRDITCVDLGWRIEKCPRFSLELNKEGLFSDEVPFVLATHAPPFKSLPVDMDGNCFFRYITTISYGFQHF